jgi:16S rRNA (adenine1518-N6/adenine1519-N6)-dimethyltransferase
MILKAIMNPKALLDEHAVQPKKSLGQNFIHDPNTLDKIVSIANLSESDKVLEIGPGTGALTTRLAKAARQVIAVELDDRLQPVLDEVLTPYPNVWVIYQDILTVDLPRLLRPEPYVVVANLPYYVTSAILKHLLENEHRPRRLVLTVQQEVAERIIAKPDDMSILSVSVQFFGQPRIAARLKPTVFWPRPEVDSAVVTIDTYAIPQVEVPDAKSFFRVVRAGFGQKRKQLKNALGSGLALNGEQTTTLCEAAGIDPRRRAETLTLEEWASLTRAAAQLS